MTRIIHGGPLTVPEETLPQQFFRSAAKNATRAAFRTRRTKDGAFEDVPYAEANRMVTDAANALLALGLEPGQKFAILSDTRFEWTVADYAILAAGGVTVTVYPTLTADQIAYLLNDSGSVGVFVSDAEQFAKVAKVASQVATLKHIVSFEKLDADALAGKTQTLAELQAKGAAWGRDNAGALEARWKNQKPDALSTIVYTSGTTGVPKGALLTHRNFVSAAAAADHQLNLSNLAHTEPEAVCMAFLPLAHCYQRLVTFMVLNLGFTVAYTSPQHLGGDLGKIQPHVFASVPRLYERMYDQILANVATAPEKRQKIFHRAADVARQYGRAVDNAGKPGLGLKLKHGLFDKLVYSKIRERLGATRLRLVITGSAAIRPDLLFFFHGIGIPILEGYGLTETSAPSNVNLPQKTKIGTVGPPFPGMEMKTAEDGEVLMKGPNIFLGYYNLPKETAESFTEDGWFKTGDIGSFDEDGFLKILDRKKEIEVLNTGKKIAPVVVEETLKTSPYIGEALLTATDRKFAGALLQPKFDALVRWADENKIPYEKNAVRTIKDPTGATMTWTVGQDLLDNPAVQKLYQSEIDRLNPQFADFERVKVWRLMNRILWNPMIPGLPIAAGEEPELTPTFKKKRRVVLKNNAKLIEEMFNAPRK